MARSWDEREVYFRGKGMWNTALQDVSRTRVNRVPLIYQSYQVPATQEWYHYPRMLDAALPSQNFASTGAIEHLCPLVPSGIDWNGADEENMWGLCAYRYEFGDDKGNSGEETPTGYAWTSMFITGMTDTRTRFGMPNIETVAMPGTRYNQYTYGMWRVPALIGSFNAVYKGQYQPFVYYSANHMYENKTKTRGYRYEETDKGMHRRPVGVGTNLKALWESYTQTDPLTHKVMPNDRYSESTGGAIGYDRCLCTYNIDPDICIYGRPGAEMNGTFITQAMNQSIYYLENLQPVGCWQSIGCPVKTSQRYYTPNEVFYEVGYTVQQNDIFDPNGTSTFLLQTLPTIRERSNGLTPFEDPIIRGKMYWEYTELGSYVNEQPYMQARQISYDGIGLTNFWLLNMAYTPPSYNERYRPYGSVSVDMTTVSDIWITSDYNYLHWSPAIYVFRVVDPTKSYSCCCYQSWDPILLMTSQKLTPED